MKRIFNLLFLIFLIFLTSSCSCASYSREVTDVFPTKESIKHLSSATPASKDWTSMPFYVKLHIYTYWGYGGSCTGNVISASDKGSSILTAAHCVFGYEKTMILVERYDNKFFLSKNFLSHPDYPFIQQNDIGLVFIDENIEVDPVPLVMFQGVTPGETVQLGGFGHSIDSEVVFKQGILIVSNVNLRTIHTRYTGIKKDYYPCFGNSGGGLLKLKVNENREYEVVGIVGVVSSGNIPCHTPGNIAQYINLFYHIQFIGNLVPDVKLVY